MNNPPPSGHWLGNQIFYRDKNALYRCPVAGCASSFRGPEPLQCHISNCHTFTHAPTDQWYPDQSIGAINGAAQPAPAIPSPTFRDVFDHGQLPRALPAFNTSKPHPPAAGSRMMPSPTQTQDLRFSNQQFSQTSWSPSEETAWPPATETFLKRLLISHSFFEPPRTQADHEKLRAIYDSFYESAKFRGVKPEKSNRRLWQLFTSKLSEIKRDMLAKGETVRMPDGNVALRGTEFLGGNQYHAPGGAQPMTTLGIFIAEMENVCNNRSAILPSTQAFSMSSGSASTNPPARAVLSSDNHCDGIELWNGMESDAQTALFRHMLRSAKSRKSLVGEWNEFCAEIMSKEAGNTTSRDSRSTTPFEQGTPAKSPVPVANQEERKPLDVREIIAQRTKELRAKRAEKERAAAEAEMEALRREEERESREANEEKSRRETLQKMHSDEREGEPRHRDESKRESQAQAEARRLKRAQGNLDEGLEEFRGDRGYCEEQESRAKERACNLVGKSENRVAICTRGDSVQQAKRRVNISQPETKERQRQKEFEQGRRDMKEAQGKVGDEVQGGEEVGDRQDVQSQDADHRLANERRLSIREEMETQQARQAAGTDEELQAQRSELEEANASGKPSESPRQHSERVQEADATGEQVGSSGQGARAQEEAVDLRSEREDRAWTEAYRLGSGDEARDRREQFDRQVQKAQAIARRLLNEHEKQEAERARVEAARAAKLEAEAQERNELPQRQIQKIKEEGIRLGEERTLKEERIRKVQEAERAYAEARRLQKEKEAKVKSTPARHHLVQAPIEPRAERKHREEEALRVKKKTGEPETQDIKMEEAELQRKKAERLARFKREAEVVTLAHTPSTAKRQRRDTDTAGQRLVVYPMTGLFPRGFVSGLWSWDHVDRRDASGTLTTRLTYADTGSREHEPVGERSPSQISHQIHTYLIIVEAGRMAAPRCLQTTVVDLYDSSSQEWLTDCCDGSAATERP
ncbi:hypothetical protein JHW43_001172 [Diplocarpon mali]|nr:hypothetical protein JHW43_001172 [Diplocarpon mali]